MIAITLIMLCCLTAPAEVHVDKDTLVLGDLIDFPAGDTRESLALGYAPNPGLARRLHDYEILGKLRVAGLPTDDLKLPDAVLVRRTSRTIDTARVNEIITGLFVGRFPDARIEILELTVPKIEVATGALDLSATLPASFNPDGPISVRLEVRARTIHVRLSCGPVFASKRLNRCSSAALRPNRPSVPEMSSGSWCPWAPLPMSSSRSTRFEDCVPNGT